MEASAPEKAPAKHKLWMRIVAAVLVIGMIATAGLIEASRVVFNAFGKDNSAEQQAADYINGNTDYLGEGLSARMADVIYAYLRTPVNYSDHYLRMSVDIAREDYEGAAESCRQCILLWDGEEGESPASLWTKLGCLYALMGDYARAKDGLTEAIGASNGAADGTVYLLRAQMEAQLGDAEGALADIASYKATEGETDAFLSVEGPLYETLGDYAAAEEKYTAILSSVDGAVYDGAVYASRARVRFLLEDYEGARADAEAYFGAGFSDTDGSTAYILAVCAMQGGDFAAAEEAFIRSIDEGYPTKADVYPSLVYSQYMQGKLDEALATGNEALASEGCETAELNEWMGVIALSKSEYEQAAAFFTRCCELDDTRTDIHYYLGICAVALNEYDTAITRFSESIERGESEAVCYYNRGVCYAATMQYQNALDDMNAALSLEPDADIKASAEELKTQLEQALKGTR